MHSGAALEHMQSPARDPWDLVIVGGGPAGLAVAVVAAEQGLSALVLERRDFPPDKACGEGLLPPAVRALERLGVKSLLDSGATHPLRGIRFIQEDGSVAESPLPGSGGLGVRRTVLVEALRQRAESLGAFVRDRCLVSKVAFNASEAVVHTSAGKFGARLVVAADGLRSPLRRAAGLDAAPCSRRRFALRQHFKVRPWTDFVEVYVDRRAEAYVTPVSEDSVNVNFVWNDGVLEGAAAIAGLTSWFPALESRLAGAAPESLARGAGPLAHGVTGRTRDRLVLIGDAAGFLDSISGAGLCLIFSSVLALGERLPEILSRGATRDSLQDYEREARRLSRPYSIVTRSLLLIVRHPRCREAIIHYLARHPGVFRAVMSRAMHVMESSG